MRTARRPGIILCMRTRLIALVAVLSVASSAIVVVAAAEPAQKGLPKYTKGYLKWPKLNRKVIKGGSPAHSGTKNVYASKKKKGKKWPNGTVIVKSIARRGDKKNLPTDVAIMRKIKGKWRWIEYRRSGGRYTVLAQGQICTSCHVMAKKNDWVFTKR